MAGNLKGFLGRVELTPLLCLCYHKPVATPGRSSPLTDIQGRGERDCTQQTLSTFGLWLVQGEWENFPIALDLSVGMSGEAGWT